MSRATDPAALAAWLRAADPAALDGPIAAATPARPQLSEAVAARHSRAVYFARAGSIEAPVEDPWDPDVDGVGDVARLVPTCVVAADGSGSHTHLQAAIDAVAARGGTARAHILLRPGVYRGPVRIAGAPPVTLYGLDADAARVLIVDDKSAGTSKPRDAVLDACEGRAGFDSYGTFASATVIAYGDGFQAKNLTIANAYAEGPVARPGPQAVALSTRGDRIVLDNVRLLGHQDTLAVRAMTRGRIDRVHVVDSLVAGDVDFVFGDAVAVFERVEFRSLTDRPGAEGDFVFAPSHPRLFPVGFLATQCAFTADAGAPGRPIHLGRAWDESVGSYVASDGVVHVPNGALLVRNCWIGGHIARAAPWAAAATTGRPFDAGAARTVPYGNPKVETLFPPNRLSEYRNVGPGAAPTAG